LSAEPKQLRTYEEFCKVVGIAIILEPLFRNVGNEIGLRFEKKMNPCGCWGEEGTFSKGEIRLGRLPFSFRVNGGVNRIATHGCIEAVSFRTLMVYSTGMRRYILL